MVRKLENGRPVRPLVVGAGTPGGRTLCRDLTSRNAFVIAVDGFSTTGVIAEVTEIAPTPFDSRFALHILNLADRYRATDLIFAQVDGLCRLSPLRREFARLGTRLQSGPDESVRIGCNRYQTARRLGDLGIPVPVSCPGSETFDPEELVHLCGLPLVARPQPVGDRGRTRLLTSVEDLRRERRHDLVFQELLPGPGYLVELFRSPGPATGGVQACVTLRKVETEWRHVVELERSRDSDVRDLAGGAAIALGLHGPLEIDVRRRADGNPAVTEVRVGVGPSIDRAPEVLDALHDSLVRRRRSREPVPVGASSTLRPGSRFGTGPRTVTLQEMEIRFIREALERTRGNKRRAARLLGISRSTLYGKLRRYGLSGTEADSDRAVGADRKVPRSLDYPIV
jgi:carbamoyl-phosphate synthase large subunit